MLNKSSNNFVFISYYLGLSSIFQQKYFSTSQIAPTSLILMPLNAQPFWKVGMKKNDIKDEVKKLLKLMRMTTTLKDIITKFEGDKTLSQELEALCPLFPPTSRSPRATCPCPPLPM